MSVFVLLYRVLLKNLLFFLLHLHCFMVEFFNRFQITPIFCLLSVDLLFQGQNIGLVRFVLNLHLNFGYSYLLYVALYGLTLLQMMLVHNFSLNQLKLQ